MITVWERVRKVYEIVVSVKMAILRLHNTREVYVVVYTQSVMDIITFCLLVTGQQLIPILRNGPSLEIVFCYALFSIVIPTVTAPRTPFGHV